MKTTHEPTEPELQLGAPVREQKPAEPDRVKPFETGTWTPAGTHIANAKSAQQTIADALRPKQVRDEMPEFTDAYSLLLLGCI